MVEIIYWVHTLCTRALVGSCGQNIHFTNKFVLNTCNRPIPFWALVMIIIDKRNKKHRHHWTLELYGKNSDKIVMYNSTLKFTVITTMEKIKLRGERWQWRNADWMRRIMYCPQVLRWFVWILKELDYDKAAGGGKWESLKKFVPCSWSIWSLNSEVI